MDAAIKIDQASRDTLSSGAPLRILGVDPELRFAGGETQVFGLTMGLVRAGHQAELACDPRGRLWERARLEGIECHPLSIRNALDFAAGLRLRNLLTRGRYDIVHFHTSRAHSMAPFARGHARALIVTRRMDYRPNRLFAPYLYNRAVDGVAAISNKVAEALSEAGVARDRLRIIPSGVDCEHFRPANSSEREAARSRIGIAREDFLVGSVGMLEERKGHRYLIEAIAIANRARGATSRIKCAIAGDGSLREELAGFARERGIAGDIFLIGMIGDARELLDGLDLFVFPSLSEGLGVALLEAMACGLPIIATRVGGIVDIVEDGESGVLVPTRDSKAIGAAMAKLSNEHTVCARIGAIARTRIVEHYSMDAMTNSTIGLYRAGLAKFVPNQGEAKSRCGA